MIENSENITDRKLEFNEEFNFQCHSGLKCFNSCCSNKRLNIYPYDMLRLRRGLNLPSEIILQKYMELEIDAQSGWPVLRIKLEEDGSCPFVTDKGCSIYQDRPTCCRMYPLTRAFAPVDENNKFDEFFYIAAPESCFGQNEKRRLTISKWIEDQNLKEYQEANNHIMTFFLHPERIRPMTLKDEEMHAIIMALYNIDVFRRFIQQPEFNSTYNILSLNRDTAVESDENILNFGQEWITALIFK